ncbi:MAG: RHS repeat-associated core domain-containing protein [Caulobacterales bacterium]|nr:RHS repeat-associated core domain-containing protein [Caulobacterales bacterium]
MPDPLSSVVALTDAAGTATQINRYDEYGVPQAGFSGRFGYAGAMYLNRGMAAPWNMRNRQYNPTLGRFMQTDPIGIAGGVNLYAYVGGDPVNMRDPFGLEKEMITRAQCIDRGGTLVGPPPGMTGGDRCLMSSSIPAINSWLDGILGWVASIGGGGGGGGGSFATGLPGCVIDFPQPRANFNLGAIRLHGGLAPFSWFDNSVTFGTNIYIAGGHSGIFETYSGAWHVFHEIGHTPQWTEGRLTMLGAVLEYLSVGGHDAAWFEVEADNFANNHAPEFWLSGAASRCSK